MNASGVGAGIRPIQLGRPASKPAPPAQPPVEFSSATQDVDKGRGVVRLLQEGHFNSVADVKLRINFQDDVAQLGADSVKAGFGDKLQSLLSGVQQEFEDLLTAIGATDEQVASATALFDGFKSAINEIANAFLNRGGDDFSALSGQVQSDFDSFIINLQVELQIESVSTPKASIEASPKTSTKNSLVNQFSSAISNHLSNFISGLDSLATALPEPSPPNNNGAAYSKFLEILEGLDAAPTQESSLPEILV